MVYALNFGFYNHFLDAYWLMNLMFWTMVYAQKLDPFYGYWMVTGFVIAHGIIAVV